MDDVTVPSVPLVTRHFTKNARPVAWSMRKVKITRQDGTAHLDTEVEAPDHWSDRAVSIVADKYLRVIKGVRETSIKSMINRVVVTLQNATVSSGLLSEDEAVVLADELQYMLVWQLFSFNSPVWFNVGVVEKPQSSACFIQSVDDNLESIMDLAKKEVMLFKDGSGTGTNLSTLRSSHELVGGAGHSSGPVSFMMGYDAFAGVTKSGGTSRRAAKMAILNDNHPDLLEQRDGRAGFIRCKAEAEKIAHALVASGNFSTEFNAPNNAYNFVPFQNANNSVRVTDDFMYAVLEGKEWVTKEVTTGKVVHTYQARDLMREIATAAWVCGDPGLQYDSAIQRMHTAPANGPITGSNPCSEYMHVDDSACNLASERLTQLLNAGVFRKWFTVGDRLQLSVFDDLIQATRIGIVAMETLVSISSYPSEKITRNSQMLRPLGIGFADLGALIMREGYSYDSNQGRAICSVISSVMTATGYATSSLMAARVGAAEGLKHPDNKAALEGVLRTHYQNWYDKDLSVSEGLRNIWEAAIQLCLKHGARNSQISVIAPTGTIGFMMDCDTTGIEPAASLVVQKKLVGGGFMTLENHMVPKALRNAGYSETEIEHQVKYVREHGDVDATCLKAEHVSIFDTAFGVRPLSAEAHIEMMAACQPFISGAISKTVNLPSSATVEDIENAYMLGWRRGLKALAVYRNDCKLSQPISAKKKEEKDVEPAAQHDVAHVIPYGTRRKLGATRKALTHKFEIGGQEGYMTVGTYDNGEPGELFLNVSKQGSTLGGLLEMAATGWSMALQHGAPVQTVIDKLKNARFEPSGFTKNPEIRTALSISDYVGRWLEATFVNAPHGAIEEVVKKMAPVAKGAVSGDGPPCSVCQNLTTRAGSCHRCDNCGSTTGCG